MEILNRVDVIKNDIYYSYYEKNELKYKIIKNFRNYYYISNDINNIIERVEKLEKVYVDEFYKIRNAKYKYESDVSLKKRFILDKFYKYIRLPKINRRWGVVDIEINSKGIINFKGEDKYEITAISLYDSLDNKIYTFFYNKDNEKIEMEDVFCFDNEYDLLVNFIDFFRERKFSIITGWNVFFDLNTLYKRGLKIVGEKINNLSNFNIILMKEDNINIFGLNIIDYIAIYKKFLMKKMKSYTLDYVAKTELNLSKKEVTNFEEDWIKNKKKFIEYNRNDVELVVKLEQKKKYLDLICEINSFGIENLEDTIFTTNTIDNILLRILHSKGYVAKSKEKFEDKDKIEIVGGYLFNVKPKIVNNYIIVFDVVSMYPSIIRMLNISPETLDKNGIYKSGFYYTMGIDLCFIDKKDGIVKQFEDYFFNLRIKEKEKMNSDYISKEEREVLNTKQTAYKILINAMYGYLGFVGSRFFVNDINKNLANAVTSTGRLIIQKIARLLKKKDKDIEIVAGDTDSVMFTSKKFKGLSKEEIIQVGKELQEYINIEVRKFLKEFFNVVNVDLFKVNFEKIFGSGIYFCQRRYACKLIWKEGKDKDEFVYVGVDLIKASTPEFVVKMLDELYKEILNGKDKEYILNKIEEYKKFVFKLKVEELGIPFTINNSIDSYKVNSVHIKGAKYFNKYFGNKGFKDFNSSFRGKYFYVKKIPVGMEETDVISIPEEHLKDIDIILAGFVLNYEKILDLFINKKIKNILSLYNIDSLEKDLFSN